MESVTIELPKQAQDLFDAGSGPLVTRKGEEFAFRQRILHKRRQMATRAYLDEDSDAIGMEPFDRFAKTDSGQPLSSGNLPHRVRVCRKYFARGTAEQWNIRRTDGQFLKVFEQYVPNGRGERGMEGGVKWQDLADTSEALQPLGERGDLVRRSEKDFLVRTIVHSKIHPTFVLDYFCLHLSGIDGAHGQQRAGRNTIGGVDLF